LYTLLKPKHALFLLQYASEEEAINTRHALHGVKWPASNPKNLYVDFGTEEAMKVAFEGGRPPPAPEPTQRDLDRLARIKEREERIKERELEWQKNKEQREKDAVSRRIVIESKWDREKKEREKARDPPEEKTGRTVRRVGFMINILMKGEQYNTF